MVLAGVPRHENGKECTFGCSPGTKAGTRVRSHVPPERKLERGHIRQNHPLRNPPLCLPVTKNLGTFRRPPCRRAKPGRFGSLAFAMKNRHFGGECSWILARKARKCGRLWVFACVPNPGKQSIWKQCPPSARKQSTKKLPNYPGFTHVQGHPHTEGTFTGTLVGERGGPSPELWRMSGSLS